MWMSCRGRRCPLPACISEQDTTSTDSPKENRLLSMQQQKLDISLQNLQFPGSKFSKEKTDSGLHILVQTILLILLNMSFLPKPPYLRPSGWMSSSPQAQVSSVWLGFLYLGLQHFCLIPQAEPLCPTSLILHSHVIAPLTLSSWAGEVIVTRKLILHLANRRTSGYQGLPPQEEGREL